MQVEAKINVPRSQILDMTDQSRLENIIDISADQ